MKPCWWKTRCRWSSRSTASCRDKLEVPRDISREELEKLALASSKVKVFLDGVTVRKVIVVPGRLVNIVAN